MIKIRFIDILLLHLTFYYKKQTSFTIVLYYYFSRDITMIMDIIQLLIKLLKDDILFLKYENIEHSPLPL